MGPVAVVAAALVPRRDRVVLVVTMTLLAAALCWPPAVALVSSAAADPESGRDVQLFSLRRGSTTVVSEAADVVIPTLSCDNPPRNLTKCQLDDCGQRMEPLIPCLTYLQSNTSVAPRPSSECCKALQRLEAASPTCFCYVTFYPPPDLNISLVLQQAMPSYCNITTDICPFCPRFLNTPDTRITCISSDDGPAPALPPGSKLKLIWPIVLVFMMLSISIKHDQKKNQRLLAICCKNSEAPSTSAACRLFSAAWYDCNWRSMEVEPPATCDLYLELEASRSACRFSSAQFYVEQADGRRLT